jgi:ATP/maltotriose-dependent transcriptional regulator MalT
LGVVAADLGQFAQARLYYEAASPLYRALGDKRGESTVLNNLSVVAYSQNQLVTALDHWEAARQLYMVIGDKEGRARVLSNLSTVCMDLGEYEKGRVYSEEALKICREIDLRFGQGFNLINLSLFAFYMEEDHQADIYGQAALQLAQEMESLPLEGMALKDRAYILTHHQRWDEADQAYQQALAVWQGLAQPLQVLEAQAGLARVALLRGDLELAQTHIQPVVAYLQAGHTPMGTSRPFYIYLVCYELLQASGDPYAETLLQQANEEMSLYAHKITDELRQQAFLQNVPDHRQLRSLFTQSANGA